MSAFDPLRTLARPWEAGRMLLHDAKAEIPFEISFDGCFPYDDEVAASALIEQGWGISLNAAFCVLDELCRPPHQNSVSSQRQRELVSEWTGGPEHALKAPLLRCATALIDGTPLPWQEGVELMSSVGEYDGQRAALSIAYFASDAGSGEGDHALTVVDIEIRQKWDAKGV